MAFSTVSAAFSTGAAFSTEAARLSMASSSASTSLQSYKQQVDVALKIMLQAYVSSVRCMLQDFSKDVTKVERNVHVLQ
jgi:hypothetical protein